MIHPATPSTLVFYFAGSEGSLRILPSYLLFSLFSFFIINARLYLLSEVGYRSSFSLPLLASCNFCLSNNLSLICIGRRLRVGRCNRDFEGFGQNTFFSPHVKQVDTKLLYHSLPYALKRSLLANSLGVLSAMFSFSLFQNLCLFGDENLAALPPKFAVLMM